VCCGSHTRRGSTSGLVYDPNRVVGCCYKLIEGWV